MIVHFDPDRMTRTQMQRVDRWLVANGVREYVALEPVTVKGRHVEFSALCRRDEKSMRRTDWVRRRADGSLEARIRRRRVRIRVPFSAVP